MAKPIGSLTGTQLEIMEVIWDASEPLKVSEVWHALSQQRKVARTTVLTMVQRLEKRGWLRRNNDSIVRYRAACSRKDAASRLAGSFVDEFFGGSTSQLVLSLLGSRKLRKRELQELRRMLEEAS